MKVEPWPACKTAATEQWRGKRYTTPGGSNRLAVRIAGASITSKITINKPSWAVTSKAVSAAKLIVSLVLLQSGASIMRNDDSDLSHTLPRISRINTLIASFLDIYQFSNIDAFRILAPSARERNLWLRPDLARRHPRKSSSITSAIWCPQILLRVPARRQAI